MIRDILKFLLFFIVFLLLTFFDSSFSNGFSLGMMPILLIIAVYNFFEKSSYFFGIFIAFIGGIMIDIYPSPYFFGLYALSFSFLSICIKLLVDRYVRVF
ncbi:MAG: hypothetical protein PHW52_04905 [Candidatus Pacebacteria bacterium]|nr:hypothetical protein [Candidatus Paceibacterota bacterium]